MVEKKGRNIWGGGEVPLFGEVREGYWGFGICGQENGEPWFEYLEYGDIYKRLS